jgi:DegV family protein with EDD domain
MEYLTQNELKRMFLLSYERIEEKKEEINKINVFPVPDQDTGTNLARTLEGIKKEIEGKEFKDLEEISKVALDGALISAQGNAGVIYTGFLAGFLPKLNKNPVDAKKLAEAFEEGRKRAWKSMANPKEGTILDVIDAAVETFKKEAEKEKDIVKIFEKVIEKAKEALLATREKMEIFKKANVVDAGGLGFLMILESYLDALRPEGKKEEKKERPSEEIRRFVQVLTNRFEVVALILDPRFDDEKAREKLKRLGNCLDIVKVENKMKIHIHTDYPDEVRDVLRTIGKIENLRIEDMAKEVIGEPSVRKVSIGIITENNITCLPEKIIERYQIETVDAIVDWPEGKNLPGENIYQKMREADKRGIREFPKTSQPTPKSYFDAFKKQLEKFDKVLLITVSHKLSGCYNSASQAKEMLSEKEQGRVYIFDSLQAAASQALFVLRAIELIQEQREIDEVLDELKKLIPKTHLYAIFEDPKWIEAGGRVSKGQANWIRRMKKLGLHPIVTIKDGKAVEGGIVFAKGESEALFKKIEKESKKLKKKGIKIRVVIQHADNLKGAEKLKNLLKEIKAEVPFISLASPVVCAHIGPGSLLAAWQPIE